MGKEVIHSRYLAAIASAAKQSVAWCAFLVTLVVTSFFYVGYGQVPRTGYSTPWLQVTALPGTESNPALSPDGRWLAFVSDQTGNREIWVMPAAGGVAKQLTNHPSADYSPAWSPDSRGLVFVSTREDAFGDLWWLPLRGFESDISLAGKPRRLTTHLGKDDSPAVSPDGRLVLFTSDRSGQDNIWILDRKSGDIRQATFDGGREAAWLADNASLLFVKSGSDDPRGNLFIAHLPPDPDRKPDPLSLADFVQGFPTVSPDGKEMAWIRITGDTNGDGILDWSDGSAVWKTGLDSISISHPVQLSLDNNYVIWPCWGHDGWIYYSSDRGGGVDIWKVPAGGPIPSMPTASEQYALGDTYLAGARASGRAPTLQERELSRLCYQKVINDYPDSSQWCAKAWYRIAQLYGDQGLRDQQNYVLRRILRFYGDYPDVASVAAVDYQVILWNESFLPGADTLFTTASVALVDNLRRFTVSHAEQVRATALARLSIANAYLKARRYQRALEAYMALRDPDVPTDLAAEAQMQIAGIFEHFGQGQEVTQSYLRVLTDYPDEVEWNRKAIDRIIALAISNQSGGSVVEGLQQIIQRFREVPNLTAAAQLRIGEELRRQGEADLALLELERLEGYRRRYPNLFVRNLCAEARLQIAELHFEKGNSRDAIQWYQRVIKEDGDLSEGRFAYQAKTELLRTLTTNAESLERDNDWSLALAEYRRAVMLDSTLVPAWQGLVRVSQMLGRLEEMERELGIALAVKPEDPVLWYAMGLLLSYKNQDSYRGILGSNRWLEGAIARDATLTSAYVTLGFNYLGLDQMGGERRRRSIGETMGESITTLSRWVTFRKRPPDVDWLERAINILRIGIALNDESRDPRTEANLLINLGNAYYQMGEFGFGTAATSYSQALRLNPSFLSLQQEALVRERLGHCQIFVGKYAESSQQLKQARSLYVQIGDVPGEWRVLLRLAELYSFSSDFDGASDVFKDISSRVDRVGKTDSRSVWLRNIAQQNLNLNDWTQADRFAKLALAQLDSNDVYRKTRVKNYLKFKILGLSIPIFNFGPLGTGSSKAEGFAARDEWELDLSVRELAAMGRKDYQTLQEVVSQRMRMAQHTGDYEMQARLDYHSGLIAFRLGDHESSLTLFHRAMQRCLEHPAAVGSPYGAMRSIMAQGNVLLAMHVSGAEDSTSLIRFRKQQSAWEKDVVGVLTFWGEKVGRISQDHAVLSNQAASLLFRKFQIERPASFRDALVRWELAAQVESKYLEALSVAEAAYYPRAQAVIEHNLGVFYLEVGDPEQAAIHLVRSYQTASASGFTGLLWRTELALAELRMYFKTAAAATGSDSTAHDQLAFVRARSADQWMQDALDLVESLPVDPDHFEEQVGHRSGVQLGYDMAMQLASGDDDNGVGIMELAERRSAMQWMWAAGVKPFAVKQETQKFIWGEGGGNAPYLQSELQRLSAAIRSEAESEKPDQQKIQALEKQHRSVSEEYQALLDKVWKEDPEFGSLFSLRAASVAEVQEAMAPDEAILRGISHRGAPHFWLILPDSVLPCHPGSQNALESVTDRTHRWSLILDSELLGFSLDSLQSFGVTQPFPNASRVGDFRSYLTARSKREIPGNQAIILHQASIGAFPDSLPTGWSAIDTRQTPLDQVMEAMSKANIIYFNLPIIGRTNDLLASYFDLGSDRLMFSQLFSIDLAASCAFVRWDAGSGNTADYSAVLNALLRSLMFSGIPSVVMIPDSGDDLQAVADFGNALQDKSAAETLSEYQDPHGEPDSRYAGWILFGSPGMGATEANAYAQDNFKRAVLKGNLNLSEGNTVWASRYYRRARQMATALGQQSALSNIDLLLLRSATEGKRWAEAEEVQQGLLDQAEKKGDQAGIPAGWRNLAYYRTQSGNVAGALDAWERVLELAKTNGDVGTQVNAQLSRSDLYRSLRNEGEALQEVDDAYRLSVQAGNQQLALTALVQKGRVQFEFDRIDSAAASLTAAEALLDSIAASEATISLTVSIFEIKGRILSILGRQAEALQYTRLALEAAHDSTQIGYLTQRMADLYWESGRLMLASLWAAQADSMFRRSGDKSYQLLNQNTRSLIALSQGDRDRAVMLAGTALELATDVGDSANVATITRNLGLIELESGKTDQAILRFKEARNLDERLQRTSGLAHDLANLGLAHLQSGQIDSASNALAQAVSVGATSSDRRPIVKAYLGQAVARWRAKDPSLSMELLDQAEDGIGDRPMGQYLWRIWHYRGLIRREQNQSQRALDAFQRAIDVLENDPVASGDYQPTGLPGNPEDAFDQSVETALTAGNVEEAFLLSDQKRRWLRDQPYQLEGLARSEADSTVLTWAVVASSIPQGTVLLAYHVAQDTAFLFVATNANLSYKVIPGGDAALMALVNDLQTGIKKLLSVDASCRSLYRAILAPAESWLASADHVIVLPSGSLWSVPFCALVDDSDRMVIDRFPVEYLTGLDRLSKLDSSGRQRSLELLAMAYPQSNQTQEELIFADREVRRIALLEPTATTYVDSAANEAILDTIRLAGRSLHFACHGWRKQFDVLASGILLQPDAHHDGIWQSREISSRELGCPLVFLNVCPPETEIGNTRQRTLSQAFFEAGCYAVISPMWEVDDLAAAVAAKSFYRYLRSSESDLAETLRLAQISARDNVNAHPAYWAGYALQY